MRHFITAILLLALRPTFSTVAHAQWMSPAFWKQHDFHLVISTTAQTIDAGDCSGALTVINENWKNVATNVTSNLTVISSPPAGVTFYTDITCTQTTASVVIPSGSSSVTVYFVDTSVGSPTFTALNAANNYHPQSVSQTETVNTNPYVWTGGGADANWTTAANWSGGAAPGSTNVALFDGTCTSNCSPTINASITVGGIYMASTYTGTITQSAGVTVTVGANNFGQLAGTFTGSSAGDAITIDGSLGISGGTFTSTSGTLVFNGYSTGNAMAVWGVYGAPTFNNNSGTIDFTTSTNVGSKALNPGSATYNNVDIGRTNQTTFVNANMTIAGNLTINGGGMLDKSTLFVGGNVTSNVAYDGNTVVELTGNAAGQTVTCAAGADITDLTINAGTNNVTLSGTITIGYGSGISNGAGNYIVTSVGTLTPPSTLIINGDAGALTLTPGTTTYNTVTIEGRGTYSAGSMTIAGNLTLDCTAACTYNGNATFSVTGNVTGTTSYMSGNLIVALMGNAAGQTVTGTVTNLTINAATNPVTLSGTVQVGNGSIGTGNYTVTSVGTLTTTGSTLILDGGTAGQNIQPGTATYDNVTIQSGGTYSSYGTFNNATMTVSGNLVLAGGAYDNGTIAVAGNVTAPGGVQGSLMIELTGNAAGQTISGSGEIPALTIAAGTNNVTMSGTIKIGESSNYLAGEGEYIVTSVGTLTPPATLQLLEPNATHTVEPGTTTYNNVSIGLFAATVNMGGETFHISAGLSFTGNATYSNTINAGTFAVGGNVTSAVKIAGTAMMQFTGGTQTVSVSGSGTFPAGNVSVTGGGILTLGSAISFNNTSQATSVTSGAINMAGYNLTLYSLSLNGNTLTKNAGTLTVNGTVVGTGSLYGGTVNP